MTSIRQIIADAFREGGIIAVGAEPSAAEQSEALRRLQSIVDSLYGAELGENLISLNFGPGGLDSSSESTDMRENILLSYIPVNTRLILNVNSPATINLHPQPLDGARLSVVDNGNNLATYNIVLDGNGRHIELIDTVVLGTNGLNRSWFYRADLGSWERVTDLGLLEDSPFPREFDDLLVTMLALRINNRYGAETKSDLTEAYRRMRGMFRARYRQTHEEEVDEGLLRLTRNKR